MNTYARYCLGYYYNFLISVLKERIGAARYWYRRRFALPHALLSALLCGVLIFSILRGSATAQYESRE